MDNDNNAHTLHAFDDPESKIRFLELTLGQKEWRAHLHFPAIDAQSSEKAAQVRRLLQHRGYKVQMRRDREDHIILSIHHLGPAPDVVGLFREYGLIHGAGQVIRQPLGSVKQLIKGVQDGVHFAIDYFKDPAHANGAVFLTAEAFLSTAGGGHKGQSAWMLKNLLQNLAGWFWMSQSVAFMYFAQKGEDKLAGELKRHLSDDNAIKHHDLATAPLFSEQKPQNWLQYCKQQAEKHPIQIGAALNNLGMLSIIAHSLMERRFKKGILATNPHDAQALNYLKKGFHAEVGGSLISLFGWTMMMLPSRDAGASGHDENLFMRTINRITNNNPQYFTTVTSMISSSGRLYGGLSKGNMRQAIGEGIYIPGDILLGFIKNEDYGNSENDISAGVIEKLSQLIIQLPTVLSPRAQQDMVRDATVFIARQMHDLKHSTPITDEQLQQAIQTIEPQIHQKLGDEHAKRFEQFIRPVARLIAHFPADAREQVITTLTEQVSALKGVSVTPDDMRQWLQMQMHAYAHSAPSNIPSMQQLAPAISTVVMTIPGPYAGENASALYDALKPLIQIDKSDARQLDNALTHTARQIITQQPGNQVSDSTVVQRVIGHQITSRI